MQDSYISSFTPSLMSPQDLEAIFVQREKLVQDLMAEVRESATTDNKHYRLLIGMRGIGKTHTIALLYHRLRSLEDLQDRLVIAWLKEEEWGVSSWLDLQIRIFQAIANSAPEEYQNQLAAEVNGLYQLSPTEATARGEIILKEFIGDRTLLILTENLDEIMKGLGDIGQKKFCAFLQNTRLVTMVATAQSLSKDLTLKKRAFYGFFNINDLDQLSLKEAGNLLTKIAELQKDEELNKFIRTQVGQDRIKAIHHLAGGNHRVYIIFSQFLTRDSLDDLVKPVMQTLDELTPYYQARMQWLSPQQRKIIELLCDRRHAVAVKEIAQRCFISHQTASSQLKDLLTKGYVVKETQGRESFYELQEPLMRICLEVKKQRGEPIKLFIDFLRIWYTNRELESRLKQLAPDCLERQYILKALELPPIFPEAIDLSKSEQLNNLLQEIVNCYRQEDYQSALTLCDRAIEIDPNDYFIWFFYGYLLAKIEQDELAIKSYNRALELNPNIDIAWFSHGCLLAKTGKYELAIKSYNRALELNPDNDNIWLNLAISLGILGQPELAIESCERALKINPDNELIWHCRGIVLHDSEKYALAVESYDRAIKLNPDSDNTWNNRGISLDELGKYELAIESYDRAIELNPDEYKTWNNRGISLDELGKYELAIESYDRAIELNSDEYKTWNNRGISLDELGKYELAIESYDRAIELNPNDDLSYFNRAEPLFKLNLWQEGFGSLEKGLSLIEISSESYLGDLRAIISIIFEAKQERETWQERINTLVELYDQYQAVAEVGQGITDNIPQLFSDMISDKAAQTWLEVWQEAAETKPELEIALRFLKTAVEYKEKSGDSKVLLQLPKEERDLFITLLPNSGE